MGKTWFSGEMVWGSVVVNRVRRRDYSKLITKLTASEGGYKNITEPLKGSSKFYREITPLAINNDQSFKSSVFTRSLSRSTTFAITRATMMWQVRHAL